MISIHCEMQRDNFSRWFMGSKSSVSCLLSIIVWSDAVMEKLYTILKVYFTFQLGFSTNAFYNMGLKPLGSCIWIIWNMANHDLSQCELKVSVEPAWLKLITTKLLVRAQAGNMITSGIFCLKIPYLNQNWDSTNYPIVSKCNIFGFCVLKNGHFQNCQYVFHD